ncbi:hypothetical protein Golax_009386, partial [Gossypium laxum]|nr:hypothetical protein [Gossypium laxum]
MEHVFLKILAEKARKGNKPSNTFKSVSLIELPKPFLKDFKSNAMRS